MIFKSDLTNKIVIPPRKQISDWMDFELSFCFMRLKFFKISKVLWFEVKNTSKN